MRLQNILLFAGAAMPVFASERAAGWEAGMMYNTYRLDGFRSAGDQTIAKDCVGTMPNNRCNFIEFLNHIGKTVKASRKTLPKINEANIPSDFNRKDPSPAEAAKVIDWEGQEDPRHNFKPDQFPKYMPGWDGSYDQRNLLGSAGMKHGDVLDKLGNAAQNARSAAGDAGKVILKDINTSVDNILAGRVDDNAESLRRDLVENNSHGLKEWKDKIGDIPTKKVTVDGTDLKYTALDSDKLLDNIDKNSDLSPEQKTKIKERINEYVTNYTVNKDLSEKGGSNGVTHHRDILAVQKISGILKSPLPEGCS